MNEIIQFLLVMTGVFIFVVLLAVLGDSTSSDKKLELKCRKKTSPSAISLRLFFLKYFINGNYKITIDNSKATQNCRIYNITFISQDRKYQLDIVYFYNTLVSVLGSKFEHFLYIDSKLVNFRDYINIGFLDEMKFIDLTANNKKESTIDEYFCNNLFGINNFDNFTVDRKPNEI